MKKRLVTTMLTLILVLSLATVVWAVVNNQPVATITSNPEGDTIAIDSPLTLNHLNSTDQDGDDIVEVEWDIKMRVKDSKGMWSEWTNRNISAITLQDEYTFNYTGAEQTWTVPVTGKYKLEVWGASAGNGQGTGGATGGYSYGQINLTQGETLYVYVGGEGGGRSNPVGGFNGGGDGARNDSGAGGGGTDYRLGGNTFNDRIVVAGGAGGGGYLYEGDEHGAPGGYGGDYQFGIGENASYSGGGGGGGWYGGTADSYTDDLCGGNGGSNYVGGMIDDGTRGTQVGGWSGNGFAKITPIQ